MAFPNHHHRLFFVCLVVFFSNTYLSLSTRSLISNPNLSPSFFVTNRSSSITDVHDLLPLYGFPKGLLPNNVKSYSLSPEGAFSVELTHPCYVQFDELVYYDKAIKGKLSYGMVSQVSGIQAKKFFLWVSVTDIQVDSGMIEFYVGAFSKKLPAQDFQTIPSCKNKSCQQSFVDSI